MLASYTEATNPHNDDLPNCRSKIQIIATVISVFLQLEYMITSSLTSVSQLRR